KEKGRDARPDDVDRLAERSRRPLPDARQHRVSRRTPLHFPRQTRQESVAGVMVQKTGNPRQRTSQEGALVPSRLGSSGERGECRCPSAHATFAHTGERMTTTLLK